MSTETHLEAAGLAETIRHVTDLWDEPLDEVRDVPQIVNAILAARYHRLARLTDDDVVEAAAEAMLQRHDDRLENPRHRGNQFPWPEHSRMFRSLAAAIKEASDEH